MSWMRLRPVAESRLAVGSSARSSLGPNDIPWKSHRPESLNHTILNTAAAFFLATSATGQIVAARLNKHARTGGRPSE
jgi:hypothetical protein